MLDPRITQTGRKIIPGFLYRRLDPFDAALDRLSREAATGSGHQRVLDAGSGEGRYARYFDGGCYVGLDLGIGNACWDYSSVSVLGDLHQLPFASHSFHRILCQVVLEHVREPGQVLAELHRVLREDGRIFVSVPQEWERHQMPHDYYRFTAEGVRYLLEKNHFQLERLEPIGGFFWLLGRRCVNLLSFFQKGWGWILFFLLAPFFGFLCPLVCFYLDRLDRDRHFTLGYLVIAKRT